MPVMSEPTYPATGDTGWGADINQNFRDLYEALTGMQQIGPLDILGNVGITGDLAVTGTVDGVTIDAHAARHENGGADEISVAGLSGALADDQPPAAHAIAGAKHSASTLANLNTKVSDATLDDSSDPRDPNAHAASHENGGGDEISAAGLSGVLADDQTPAAHAIGGAKHSTSTLANLNTKVSDATLDKNTDTRTPKAHKATHQSGGGDAIKLDDLAAPDDNVDLNASVTKHGLLKKLDNVVTNFLNGQGGWSVPAGGGGANFKSGTYTGDGTTSKAITGLGFAPKYVRIFQYAAGVAVRYIFERTDLMGGDWSLRSGGLDTDNNAQTGQNMLISLDADGFTVDNGGIGGHPNANAAVYLYVAWG